MRSDLLGAYAGVEVAKAKIPAIQQAFIDWQRSSPYSYGFEPDTEVGYEWVIATEKRPLPPAFSAEIGVILNSLRAALDVLASTLACRNGVEPHHTRHFPIFDSLHDLIDPKDGIKSKRWLSESERTKIESLKPYQGGNPTLWRLHKLDIVRKHERLLNVELIAINFEIIDGGGQRLRVPNRIHMETKTRLLRTEVGRFFRIDESNTRLTLDIFLNEIAFGVTDEPASKILWLDAHRIERIIGMFNSL